MCRRGFIIFLNRWLVDLDSLCLDHVPDTVLEANKILGGQRVGLGHDRNEVHAGGEALHDLNVEWLQGMAGRADEVEAGMYSEVNLVSTTRLLFLQHVRLVLVVQKFDNWHP